MEKTETTDFINGIPSKKYMLLVEEYERRKDEINEKLEYANDEAHSYSF